MQKSAPLRSICLLRTSALGDVTHVVPLLHTLRKGFPDAHITWIIGKLEQRLLAGMEGVEFVVFDKSRGLDGFRKVRRTLHGQRFDALLHMQVALRSNLLSLAVHSDRRIGYDHARSKDLHGCFVRERIAASRHQHVLDAMGSFVSPLGLESLPVYWDLPVAEADHAWAATQLHTGQRWLLINAVSSHALRNWRAERYAAVADHAITALGWRVALTGGPGPHERALGDAILGSMRETPLDLIGRDTLKRALALYARADALLTPDSGPMHMANAMGTPVLGLHAASNPDRSGPYSDRRWCVNAYPEAARKYRHCEAYELRWGSKLEYPGVMDLVTVDAVVERLEALAQSLSE